MRGILKLFGKSPFEALVQHTQQVESTVEMIRPLFEAQLAGEVDRLNELHEEISRREHEADKIKNGLRDHLPRSLFLPVNRGDILAYVKEQDGIADAVEDLAVILSMRRPAVVEGLRDKLMEFIDQILKTTGLFFDAARGVRDLEAASFTGPEVDHVLEVIAEVNKNEWQADQLQAEFSKLVFSFEERIDPISVFQWMHVAEVLGDVADRAENTGDVLRLMLARA